jgi:phenylacetate-CoA ligase
MTTEIPFSGIEPAEQQQRSLQLLLDYVRDEIGRYHPYYRTLFRGLGIAPGDLKNYDDFRRIPITTKSDIVENQADFNLLPRYPGAGDEHDAEEAAPHLMQRYRAAAGVNFRDIFGPRPEEERVREQFLLDWRPIHFQMSGGTTGKAVVTGYTYTDLTERFARSGAWWYALNPVLNQDDKWLNLLPAAPHLAVYATLLIPLLQGQPNFNTFGGKVTPTEAQIQLAAADRFSVVIALPSYLMHWLRTAVKMRREGRIPTIATFRAAYCVGEPITEAYRTLLKALFAELGSETVTVVEGMSSTELRTGGFYECAEGSKLHFDPAGFFAEVLDPDTREPVPSGQPGVFVWSHIGWHGTAILRYWTGDYVSGGIDWGTCPHCSHTIPRLITPIWRADKDETKIRGTRVEAVTLLDAVRGAEGIDTFQIVLRKQDQEDPFSRDLIDVAVSVVPGVDPDRAADNVRSNVKQMTELTPDSVSFATTAEIEARLFAKKLKAEWLIDERPAPHAGTDAQGAMK